MGSSARSWAIYVSALLATLALLSAHIGSYQFLNDDAYISFRYAKHWAELGEITYNVGVRVEGYTNFLWVALLALTHALGGDIPQQSLIWGGAFGVLSALSVGLVSARRDAQWRDLLPVALLALSPSFACWSSGGLEVQLFTFTFTGAALLSARAWESAQSGHRADHQRMWGAAAGVMYALCALTRPEGVGLFMVAGAYRVITLFRGRLGEVEVGEVESERETGQERERERAHLRWSLADSAALISFLSVYVPYFAWRAHYYGYLLPNTYYVKTGASGFWSPGLRYVSSWLIAHPWLALAPLAPLLSARLGLTQRARDLMWLALLSSALIITHVARVGGDFMALHRFLVPLLPLLALTASPVIFALISRVAQRLKWALITCMMSGLIWSAHDHYRSANRVGSQGGVDSIGWLRQFSEQCAYVGRWIATHTPPDATLATTAAGALPYYAERHTLDLLGLNDAWIAHNVPARGSRPGHTKSAPFTYPLRQEIDYLIYHPHFSARRAEGSARFARALKPWGYRWEMHKIEGLTPPWWGVWRRGGGEPSRERSSTRDAQ